MRDSPSARDLAVFGGFLGLALAIVWLVYGRAAGYPFLLDDVFHLLENPSVRAWSGLPTLWTTNYWEWYGDSGLYRPLLKTLFAVEIVGLGGGRGTLLVVSAAGHALAGTLVAWIAWRVGVPRLLALAAGLWFLLHAAHSEVVITGVGQGEILSLALGLTALACALEARSGRPVWLAGCVACALASTLAKEQGFASAAVAAAALAWSPACTRSEKRIALLALAAGLALVVAARLAVLGSLGPGFGYTIPVAGGFPERELLPVWLVGRYVVLALAPVELAAHYDWLADSLPPGLLDPFLWIGVLAAGVSIEVGVRAWRRRDRTTGLLLLATWLPLAPFLAIVPIGSLFAERHAYHALAGLALLLAWGGTALLARLGARQRSAAVAALAGVVVIGAAALGLRAWQRVPAWRSATELWSSTLREHPRSAFAAVSLAQTHDAAGRIGPARRAAERALEIGRNLDVAHLVLGNLAQREGRPRAAIPHYEQAARSPVYRFDARVGLALVHLELGHLDAARALHEELAAERPRDLLVRRIGSELAHAGRPASPAPDRELSAPRSPRPGVPGSR